MGKNLKKNVEFVISHFPGSSGNFLARLITNKNVKTQDSFYRIDTDSDSDVLAREYLDLESIKNHRVLTLHDFNKQVLDYFPNARHIAIYPYSNIGNVIYNISTKKFTSSMSNIQDQYFLLIKNWHEIINQNKPEYKCWDYKNLRSIDFLQKNLFKFSKNQIEFFETYWNHQLDYNLNIPSEPMSIEEIISRNNIEEWCNDWSISFVIYCYEYCNNLLDIKRHWSVDKISLTNWQDVCKIQKQYEFDLN